MMKRRLDMSRVISAILLAVLVIFSGPLKAYADIDPASFSPRRGTNMFVIRSDNQKFLSYGGDFTTAVNGTSDGALIPGDPDYMYMVKNEYNNSHEKAKPYTSRLDGSLAQDSYIDALSGQGVAVNPETRNPDGSYKYPTNRSHFWWFKMSTESGNAVSGFRRPKVKWTGLYVYDKESETNQAIDLYMEVVTHSMAGSFSNSVPALFSVSKTVKGLPSIRIYHVGAIQLRFTVKKAGTDELYPLKTGITFGDVDGRQSVSALIPDTGGFAALSSANLMFGPYGTTPNRYWSATGNTDNNVEYDAADADRYKIQFYINTSGTGSFDMVFTSSQKDNNRPSGNFARFYAATYENPDKPPVKIELAEPVKYVTDTDSSDDFDTSHNTLGSMADEMTYTVVQKIPQYMYSGLPETDLSEFSFSDALDSCLEYVPESMRIYAVRDSAEIDRDLEDDPVSLERYEGSDVTDMFSTGCSGGKVTAEWKNSNTDKDRDDIIYSGEDGTVFKFVFRAKIKEGISFSDISRHEGENGSVHGVSDDTADIPNRAEISYRLRSESASTALRSVNEKYDGSQSESEKLKNSFVYTRVNDPGITVKFRKVDRETGDLLPGARMAVFEGEEAEGDPLDSWTSVDDIYESPYRFRKGSTYTYAETEAPYGYSKAEDIVFTVTEDDQVVTMEDDPLKADISVSKNVTGSLGDTTKEFEFVLDLNGAAPGERYKAVKGDDETEVTSDSQGNARFEFTLKDEEGILIKDIRMISPSGDPVQYRVTEKASNHRAEYVTDSEKSGRNESSGRDLATEMLSVEEDRIVSFTNERDLAPPTDAPADMRAYIVLIAALAALVIIRLVRA